MDHSSGSKSLGRHVEPDGEDGPEGSQKRRRTSDAAHSFGALPDALSANNNLGTESMGTSSSGIGFGFPDVDITRAQVARRTRTESVESTISSLGSLSEHENEPQSAPSGSDRVTSQSNNSVTLPKLNARPPDSRKHWPAQLEVALVQFLAKDAGLRDWAKGGPRPLETLTSCLQGFSDQAHGKGTASIFRKVSRMREHYERFAQRLKPANKYLPIGEWKEEVDLRWMEGCVSHFGPWVKVWHHEIASGNGAVAPSSSVTPTEPSGSTHKGLQSVNNSEPTGLLGNSSQRDQHSSLQSLNSYDLPAASSKTTSVSTLAASTSNAASPSSSDPSLAQVTRGNSQLASVPAQLKQQARQIQELQAQSTQQNLLLSQQAKLLKRQTAQLDAQNALAEDQATQLTRQTYAIENVKQQLEALHALLVRQLT